MTVLPDYSGARPGNDRDDIKTWEEDIPEKQVSSFEMTIWSKQKMSKCCQKCSVGYPALKLIIYRDSI